MKPRLLLAVVNVVLVAAFVLAGGPAELQGVERPVLPPITRTQALALPALYDDPQMVSDAELWAVLDRLAPRFEGEQLKTNFVEHAIRIWGIGFRGQGSGVGGGESAGDVHALSGSEMLEFLTDHRRFAASWGGDVPALLIDAPYGVKIRWGSAESESRHHDHWLACLSEAGATLDMPVITPTHRATVRDVLEQALADFRLDEREVEWTAMVGALWLTPAGDSRPPVAWINDEGRVITFDMLARRLLRSEDALGVCYGTHRLYSLALLLRADEFDGHGRDARATGRDARATGNLLSPEVRREVIEHLQRVSVLLVAGQHRDGYWPPDWPRGAEATATAADAPVERRVLATGHHLEWLGIAPEDVQPPRECLVRAARWLIGTVLDQSPEHIHRYYTYYSHVGGALALWRGVRAGTFYDRYPRQ